MPVTLPFDLTVPPKREIKAAELMAMYNALAAKFSGGIVDADLSAALNLNGAKIQAGSIPANRLVDGSVTSTQLADNSVGTSELADGSVTALKVLAGSLTRNRLKVTIHTHTIALGLVASGFHAFVAGASFTPPLPLASASQWLSLWIENTAALNGIVARPNVNGADNTMRVSLLNLGSGSANADGQIITAVTIAIVAP